MKQILILLVTILLLLGCDKPEGNRTSHEGYSIIVIDNCEYIEVSSMLGAQSGYYAITHKGNCKFCKQR